MAAAILLCLLSGSDPAPARAQAACPSEQTAAKGYRLTSKDGRLLEVTGISGDIVSFRERLGNVAGAKTREQTAFRGLLLLTSGSDGILAKSTFEADLSKLFPVTASASHDLAYVISMEGAKDRAAHITLEVADAISAVAIGACSYETWKIKKTVIFLDTRQVVVITDYWSPALSMYLRREVAPMGAPPGTAPVALTFDAIEAVP